MTQTRIRTVVLFVVMLTAIACDGRAPSPTLPTESPVSAAPPTFTPPTAMTAMVLVGQVTDRTTSAPVSGAIVRLNGWEVATTDSSGSYWAEVGLVMGFRNFTYVVANNYEADYRHIGGPTHNVHLYPIKRITAGASTSVVVEPDDTLCVNNMQDQPNLGPDYRCRSVRVVAPSSGVMMLEALSTTNGPAPLLEVEIVTGSTGPCCSERLENPTSILVTAGTEVVAHVEMPFGATTSQSFTLNTSMRPR